MLTQGVRTRLETMGEKETVAALRGEAEALKRQPVTDGSAFRQ